MREPSPKGPADPHRDIGADPVSAEDGRGKPARRTKCYSSPFVQNLSDLRYAAPLEEEPGQADRPAPSRTDGIVAHELRQPLFAIGMAGENLRLLLDRADLDRPTMRVSVLRIIEQVQRAQDIIEQTLANAARQARADMPSAARQALTTRSEATDVAQSIRRAIRQFDSLVHDQDILFSCHLPDHPLLVDTVPIELEQVLVNLIRNALESIVERRAGGWAGHGLVTIRLRQAGDDLLLTVADNGTGLPAGHADTLFLPFHTTKASGGTGLGLHICREIVARSGGVIQARTRSTSGAEFEIRLPVQASEPGAFAAPGSETATG